MNQSKTNEIRIIEDTKIPPPHPQKRNNISYVSSQTLHIFNCGLLYYYLCTSLYTIFTTQHLLKLELLVFHNTDTLYLLNPASPHA